MKDDSLSPKFKLRLDPENDPPEDYHQEELVDRRIDKVNLRITLQAFLIPAFMGVILFVLYLQFDERLTDIQNSGSVRVQSMSRDMEGRLTALTLQYTKLGDLLEENYQELEKHIGRLQDQVELTRKTVDTMTASKVEANDLQKAVTELSAAMKRQLEPVAARQEALQAEIRKTSRELGSFMPRFNETTARTSRDMEALRAKLAALEEARVSPEVLKALQSSQTRLKEEQAAAIRKLSDRLAGLEAELKRVAAQKTEVKVVPAQPGTILEQDIPE